MSRIYVEVLLAGSLKMDVASKKRPQNSWRLLRDGGVDIWAAIGQDGIFLAGWQHRRHPSHCVDQEQAARLLPRTFLLCGEDF